MIAGNPSNDIEEIKYAIREICPNMGIIEKNGEIVLVGSEISRLKNIQSVLSKISRIEVLNKYETMAALGIRDDEVKIMDMREKRGDELCATV